MPAPQGPVRRARERPINEPHPHTDPCIGDKLMFSIPFPALYFPWLQKNNPTGVPDRFPELRNSYETSVDGVYCIGDLTGIPLLKTAAQSGFDLINTLSSNKAFATACRSVEDGAYALIILGAGPAGVAASLRAQERGIRHLVIESSRAFTTIHNFPAGKPIHLEPAGLPSQSPLPLEEGTKETLLARLGQTINGANLPLHEGETATRIIRENGRFTVVTSKGSYQALRVIIAIGKTGNARTLGVPGEGLPKVFSRLIDPGVFHEKEVLVVGGGDTAVEAAVSLAGAGNHVTLSYRGAALSRPKEYNRAALQRHVAQGSITPVGESTVATITETDVLLNVNGSERRIPNDVVFVLIGSDVPAAFFRSSGIRLEGEMRFADRVKFAALVLFACVLYFGKKAPVTAIHDPAGFFAVPEVLTHLAWPAMINGLCAWGAFMGLAVCALYIGGHIAFNRRRYFSSAWGIVKYGYYSAVLVTIAGLYAGYKLLQLRPVLSDMGEWYTVLYSLTIVVFGLRRMAVNPTGYIRRQTITLMTIQVGALCLLPMFLLPFLGTHGLLGDWVMRNVFPGESYWRAYGLVLAWPLFIHNVVTHQPTVFWLCTALVQTFVIIPLIVLKWGKGAYCGWICSCGALAETLGNEYRTGAPHGPAAKKLENAGQFVLWSAALITLLTLVPSSPGNPISGAARDLYGLLVDIVFAGVLGVGVYFFMSGRVWCRFLCPLAALMHLFARFSVYRIFADKKRCISCSICTKICHMGIDVMGYANKGIPMNDVQCVRCSACVVSCPMDVLSLGRLPHCHPENDPSAQETLHPVAGWATGRPERESA